jgi:hypothetical protein
MAMPKMSGVVIIDDAQICKMLSRVFDGMGHTTYCHQTLKQGFSAIQKRPHSVSLQFCPRFFTTINEPSGDLCAVLNKMTQHRKQ